MGYSPHVTDFTEWGHMHPNRREGALRVDWTVDEEAFIEDYYLRCPRSTVKECYRYVLQSITAKALFHPNHVISWQRLEHIVKKVKKRLQNI